MRKTFFQRLLFQSILAAASAIHVWAGVITYSDGTFTPSDWSVTIIHEEDLSNPPPSLTQLFGQANNPGYFQQTYVGEFCDFHTMTIGVISAFTYTPSTQGAIDELTMGYDLFSASSAFQDDRLILTQGSGYYQDLSSDQDGRYSDWTTFSTGPTTSADWTLLYSTGPANPDFSSTGGTLGFGYMAASTSVSSVMYVDNFNVGLITSGTGGPSTPEPATVGLAGCSLLALTRLRKRR